MLRYLTAGESHGPALTAIVEGFPSGVRIDRDFINQELRRRQGGYGRGKRQTLETDLVAFIRGDEKFDGLDSLKAQIARDCETARGLLLGGF